MARRFLLTALVALCLPLVTHSATWEGSYTVGSADNTETPAEAVAFVNSTGLYTSPTELNRFKDLADAAGTDQYDTDLASLLGSSHAGGVDTDSEWNTQHTISEEEYEGDNSTCRPSSVAWNAGNVENYDLTEIASSLYSLALAGSIEDDESYFTEAHNHLLELTETSFDLTFNPNLSIQNPGSDQCGLDLATAIPWIAETAMLLEQESFAAWSYADRLQLATWMAEEVFPLVHWTTQRKNNWGPAGLSGALAIAWYVDGPITSIVRFDGASITPASYYGTGIGNDINRWISNSTPNELDSATSSLSCAFNSQVFGIQPTGTVPDDVRRSTDFNDCDEPDLEFAGCLSGGGPYTSGCGGFSGAVFYQQKSTQLLTRTFEALRRIDGDGLRGYELAYREHGGANEVLYDMILASTTLTTGSSGDFQDVWTTDTTQGYRWMAGQYYGLNKAGVNSCITGLLDDSSVFIEGGNDVPYSRITHADGVAYTSVPSACGSSAGTFVTVAESGLSAALKSRLPYNYASSTPLVDTSAWTERDVTTVGGTNPAGDSDFTSCSDIVGDGSDSTTAFRCMWANMAENECLYFPNGTYDFLTAGDFQHVLYYSNATDHRCVRGESEAGVELQFGRTYPTNPVVNFIAGDNSSGTVWGAAAVDWTSGFERGTIEIVVDDASSFAEGEWVWLSANPNSLQVGGEAMDYQARVTDITSNTLTIDRPLPDDFTGTSPTARRWLPAEQISFENLTLTYNEPSHQLLLNNIMMWFRHTADSSFSNIHFKENYQYGVMVESSARIRGDTFKVDKVFDKAFNNYALSMNGSTDGLFNNFTIWNSTQGISCAGASHGNVFGFFAVANTESNQPAFDRDCDGGTCDIVDHSGDHGTTVGAAYLHCSSNDEDDASGTGGAANSCRGTRDDRMSGGILFHGASCSNSSFVRGYVEGGIWSDYLQGAGRNNLLFGLAIKPPAEDSTIPIVGGGMGNLGDIGFKDVGGVPNGGTYRNNFLLVGSNIDNLGTGGRNAFDAYMDGARVEHNVIRSTCRYDGGASPNAAADEACADQTLEAGEVGGELEWNDNEVGVGSSARTSTVVLPTAPGYTQEMLDDLTGGSGDAPWYGADMGGDGGVGTNCSPAYMAYYGSCP